MYELAEHFVMWEYAIAMCGYLMKVCPFDQPDVASAKAAVLDILRRTASPSPIYVQDFVDDVHMGQVEVRHGSVLQGLRRRARIAACAARQHPSPAISSRSTPSCRSRAKAAARRSRPSATAWPRSAGVVSCLEVGPRYLHSTGQLQKGGPNCGVFLILSADELKDIPLKEEAESLGFFGEGAGLAATWSCSSSRGRRCVHLHLPDNSGVTLRALAEVVCDILEELQQV